MMRERLAQLLRSKSCWNNDCPEGGCEKCDFIAAMNGDAEHIADCLLANGVVVPPCKVGDKVYHICNVFNDSKMKSETIIKTRVVDFVQSMAFLAESQGLIFSERDFGKTVFLTREEAERALEGGADNA